MQEYNPVIPAHKMLITTMISIVMLLAATENAPLAFILTHRKQNDKTTQKKPLGFGEILPEQSLEVQCCLS